MDTVYRIPFKRLKIASIKSIEKLNESTFLVKPILPHCDSTEKFPLMTNRCTVSMEKRSKSFHFLKEEIVAKIKLKLVKAPEKRVFIVGLWQSS